MSSPTEGREITFAEAVNEALVPVAEHVAEQHPERPSTFGGEIGQVHRDELPRHIGHVLAGEPMDALDHHVVGQDKRLAAHFEDGGVVGQVAGGGVGRQPA